MTYLYSFLFCGFVCAVAQIILDNTKLTAGHITSIFVVVGAFLDVFNIYDKIILKVGGGSLVSITSFGLKMGLLSLTAAGITSAIIYSFIFALIFKPKN